jgi:sulfonate transport system permease protein
VFKEYQLPPPLKVVTSTWNLWERGLLQRDILETLFRVFSGFAIGSGIALLLGTVTGLSKDVDRFFDPTLQAVRTVPTLAWSPLLVLWLGIGDVPKIVLVAIGAFFPVYLSLVSGVRNVDRKLVEVGRVYNLSWTQIALQIILPSSLPSMLTGLRLGLSQAWLFVVVAEMMGAVRGLGFVLVESGSQTSRVDLLVGAMIILAILGKLSDTILKFVETRLLSWRDTFAPAEGNA